MIMLDYFSLQAELRSSATEVSPAAASHECVTSPTSVSQEKGAGDSNYQIFHIHAPSVSDALVYNHNTLHNMLTSFQEDGVFCSFKLTCHDNLVHQSLPCVSASPEPKKLTCLRKGSLGLSVCTFKLDLSLFLNSVKICCYRVLCMLNDTGVGIKEMIDSNGFMHGSTNRFTICNTEDGFRGGLVNTGTGFSSGYIRNVSSTAVVSCSCEDGIKNSTVSLLEFCDTGSVVCVGGKSSSVDLDCNWGNFGASASKVYADISGSKKIILQEIYNSPAVTHFNISTKKVSSSTLDRLHSLMIVVSDGSKVDILTSVHSRGIMQGNLIPTQLSDDDDTCSGYCTSVKVTELHNSEIAICRRYFLESMYCPKKFAPLNDLIHLYPVSEGTGSNVTCILQLFCTLQDMCSSSVAQELLNNQNGQGIVCVSPLCREQITLNSECHEFDCEVKNISDTLASFLCQNCGNSDHLVLRQDFQAISSPEWSRILLQALSFAFTESSSVCNFHKHDIQNMPDITEFRNDPCSQITICRSFRCAFASLLHLYPFCNCLLLRWLCSQLLAGPILSVPFRYFYRCYNLLCFVSKFKCLFFSVCDIIGLRNRLLCIVCLERH
jgi:hypothetical protein